MKLILSQFGKGIMPVIGLTLTLITHIVNSKIGNRAMEEAVEKKVAEALAKMTKGS